MIKRSRLRWLGHVECEDDGDWVKQCMSMEMEVTRWRGCPRITWWDCDNMKSFDLSHEDAQHKDDWRLRIKGQPANPGLPGKWPLKLCLCIDAKPALPVH